ncbi:MAG: agmatinase [Syntrophobacteraceae bacterium]|jgi:agmatinase|nr:agmatinase [Syntrophobacteraceae bacterium]
MDASKEMGFQPFMGLGPHQSFLGLAQSRESYEAARAVVIPVPYDGTTTYRAGTREGPRAILAASRELEPFDEETGAEVREAGIATLEELPVTVSSPRDMVNRVRSAVAAVFDDGKLPVLLGGEHLLSLGAVEALAERIPRLSVLHLDAHADLKTEYQGSPFSNACVMHHVSRLASLVQVGIRSLTLEERNAIGDGSIPCFWGQQLWQDPALWDRILDPLGPEVYISIDLDVLDPSIMPAVGTPEPGGVGWYDVLRLMRRVARERRVVGFDVMELLPIPHVTAPDFLAARLVYKLLGYILMDKGPYIW